MPLEELLYLPGFYIDIYSTDTGMSVLTTTVEHPKNISLETFQIMLEEVSTM